MTKIKNLIYALPLMMLFVASPVFAGDVQWDANLWGSGLLDFINQTLIPLVIAIALVVFFWGMIKYFMLGADDPNSKASGRGLMLYSLIALVIMVAVWGIVNLIIGVFGLGENRDVTPPGIPANNTTS